jgi:hypothetical protein
MWMTHFIYFNRFYFVTSTIQATTLLASPVTSKRMVPLPVAAYRTFLMSDELNARLILLPKSLEGSALIC